MSGRTPRRRKRYRDMSADELRAATRQYNAEDVSPKPAALSAKAKAAHARTIKALRAQSRKAGRPQVGEGATSVLVSLERGLLAKADTFADAKKMSRSEVVARSLVVMLAMQHGMKIGDALAAPFPELLARLKELEKGRKSAKSA